MLGQRDDLVTGILDGARLMLGDVAGTRGDYRLVLGEQGGDRYLVRLRAADEKLYLQIVPAASLTNFRLGGVGALVKAVAGKADHILFTEMREHLGVCALGIIRHEI